MSQPPFTMSKYATKEDLLKDKCEWLEQQLAEAQARIKVLEDALNLITQQHHSAGLACSAIAKKVLSTTSPPSELDKLLADEREKCAKVCKDFGSEPNEGMSDFADGYDAACRECAEAIRRIEP